MYHSGSSKNTDFYHNNGLYGMEVGGGGGHTVQTVLSKHLRIIKMCLQKTGACLILMYFNVFARFGS